MRKTTWKFFITGVVLTLAIIGASPPASPASYEDAACPEDMYLCFCDRGGWLCAQSSRDCEEMLYALNCRN
jgi:hypothetical protein